MDANDIIIEQAKEVSDELAIAIEHLAKQEGNNFQPLTEDDLQEMVESPKSFLFLAKHVPTGEIAGMLFVRIYRIPYTRKAYIDDVVVDENFRRRGIATKLLEKAIETARKHRVAYVMLTASATRGANNLYEKFGFTKRESNAYRVYL